MLFIFDMGGVVTNTAILEGRISNLLNITEQEFKNYINHNNLFLELSNGKITPQKF